jgi:uncharacterized protein YcbX
MAIIHSIYRYPVKGLSPEALPRIALAPGETVPGDRLYAIEIGIYAEVTAAGEIAAGNEVEIV